MITRNSTPDKSSIIGLNATFHGAIKYLAAGNRYNLLKSPREPGQMIDNCCRCGNFRSQ